MSPQEILTNRFIIFAAQHHTGLKRYRHSASEEPWAMKLMVSPMVRAEGM